MRPLRFLPYSLQHKAAGRPRMGLARFAAGLTVRGVVLKVSPPGTTVKGRSTAQGASAKGWVCDVLVIEPGLRTILSNVPVMGQSAGVDNYAVQPPKAVTGTLSGAPLVISPERSGQQATPVQDMNGDYVVVGFLGNDLNQPYIMGQLPHPATTRTIDPTAALQQYVAGNALSVSELGDIGLTMPSGNVLSTNLLGAIDLLMLAPLGELNITMFTGDLDTGRKVRVLDADPSSTEPEAVLRGVAYLEAYKAVIGGLSDVIGEIAAALSDPTMATLPACLQFTLNAVTWQDDIQTSLDDGHPFLSTHVEID